MKVALVIGVNGQDGSYLAESLLRRGVRVMGIGRDTAPRYASMADIDAFRYVRLDLTDGAALSRLIDEVRPDVAFHFAAVHGAIGAGFGYESIYPDLMRVNVLALHALLEHARLSGTRMRIIYASSSKVFPEPWSGSLDESTPMRATCLYSISKLTARDLMLEYARRHGVTSTNLILFNHDSPRRPAQYFLPTIASALRAAIHGRAQPVRINTLDFRIDWSAADELMEIVADIAFAEPVPEVLVASGRTVLAREAVAEVFQRYGKTSGDHIIQVQPPKTPNPAFRVDIAMLEGIVKRRPVKTVQDIIDDLVAERPSPAASRIEPTR